MMWANTVAMVLVSLGVICMVDFIRKRRSQLLLPPGSMGLPFIGEALSLVFKTPSFYPPPFITTRVQRYGPIFRTKIFRQQVVVSVDEEMNHYILNQEGNHVEIWYFETLSKIFNFDSEGQINSIGVHRYARNLLLKHMGAETLKRDFIFKIEDALKNTLNTWSTHDGNSSVDIRHGLITVLVNFIAKTLIGYEPEESSENLSEIFAHVMDGFVSLPLNIPGTTYHKCIKDKEKFFKMMREMIKERLKETPSKGKQDFLGQLINDMGSQKFMTQDFIITVVYAVIFATNDTILAVLPLLLLLVEENPLVLRELEKEHESLVKRRSDRNSSLTWDEYKSLTFTRHVINETLRLTNILPGMMRRARKDIHVKGYVIPAGWSIMVVTSSLHLNSTTFPDPLKFDPWRWEKLDSETISKNFMPFGGGVRLCPGSEYARVFITTFLHVLVTKYTWTKIKGGHVYRRPMITFGSQGMHVKFTKK